MKNTISLEEQKETLFKDGMSWIEFLDMCIERELEISYEDGLYGKFLQLYQPYESEEIDKNSNKFIWRSRDHNKVKFYPGMSINNSPHYKGDLKIFIELNESRIILRSFHREDDSIIYRIYIRKLERNRNKLNM
jgi:rubrerythrin